MPIITIYVCQSVDHADPNVDHADHSADLTRICLPNMVKEGVSTTSRALEFKASEQWVGCD